MSPKLYAAAVWLFSANVFELARTVSVSSKDEVNDVSYKPVVRTLQRADDRTAVDTVLVSATGLIQVESRKPVVRTLQRADHKTLHGKGSEAANAKSVARIMVQGELGTSTGTASRRASTEPALDHLGQASKHEQQSNHRTSSMLDNLAMVAMCGLVFGFLLAVFFASSIGGQSVSNPFQRVQNLLGGAANQDAQPTLAWPTSPTSPFAARTRARSLHKTIRQQDSPDVANVGRMVSETINALKERASFKGKMWKLNQDAELDDDRNDWKERAVWISQPGHLYYFSDQQSRDQRFFDQAARDLRIVELHLEGNSCSFFKYCVRVENNVQNKQVYLATDSNTVMTKFLEVLREGGSRS